MKSVYSYIKRHTLLLFSFFVEIGLIRRALKNNDGWNLGHGIGPQNQHIYKARAGLWDVDYIGHMNNAAFLSHAEYARWEMAAESGMLRKMASDNILFIVSANFVRYRREIRPLFQSFQVETTVSALDIRHMWFFHNFRYANDDRIRAQVVVQGVVMQRGQVLTPSDFLTHDCGHDPDLIQSLVWPDGENVVHADLLKSYRSLDDALRTVAAEDDAKFKT